MDGRSSGGEKGIQILAPCQFSYLPGGKFLGTVLTPVSIFRYPSDTQREIGPGDLILDTEAGYYTPAEFEEKYLSPDYDEGTQQERYGKDD